VQRCLRLESSLVVPEEFLYEEHPLVEAGVLLVQFLLAELVLTLQAALHQPRPALHLFLHLLPLVEHPPESPRTA
jgi:hypothetical protein